MTIHQALKKKAQLVKQIHSLTELARDNNSFVEGSTQHFSASKCLAEVDELTKELVALKTKIHLANKPVHEKIFLMGELKSQVKNLKLIPTDEGQVASRWSSTVQIKQVDVNAKELHEMIQEKELQIQALQDELDHFNATTEI